MKSWMKWLLAGTMVMGLSEGNSLAATATVGGVRWSYDISSGMATVTRAYPASGHLKIPSTLGGYPVTSIGYPAFCDCYDLTSVEIPDSVTSIDSMAFSECRGLTAVHIHDLAAWCGISFENIVANPLYWAHHLYLNGVEVAGDLAIPDSVTSIGTSAFYGCSGLRSVAIPDSVTNIGYSAFYGCSGLTDVAIPASVALIEESAFGGCSGLKSFQVATGNPSYKAIGGVLCTKDGKGLLCFPSGNTGEYTIPNSVTNIGRSAFEGCSGLTSVTIPDSVTVIGEDAFRGCSGLTSITIPGSVTSIGWMAFEGCSGLTSVTIPSSVTSIDVMAFSDCNGLTAVHIHDLAAWCGISFGGVYASNTSNPLYYAHHLYLNGVEVAGDLAIPDRVTNIGNNAFMCCSALTSVTIPNSVTSIGTGAFYDCSGLTSIAIPDSVSSIGYGVFSGCSGLTTVYAPESWKTKYVDGEFWSSCASVPEGCQVVYREAEDTGTHNGVQLWEGGPYWAETNVGAEEPWEYGLYFWWGDTVGYRREGNAWVASDGSTEYFSFSSENTPTYTKDNTTLQSEGWITAAGVLAPEHDAAHVKWGGGWRMPTDWELEELCNQCDWTWTATNGVNGYVVRGRGNFAEASIFIPASGRASGASLDHAGTDGRVWSSVPSVVGTSEGDVYVALDLGFNSDLYYAYSLDNLTSRSRGQSIRPVRGSTGLEPVKYTITVGDGVEGVDRENAAAGEMVTVWVSPTVGMRLVGVYVNGVAIEGNTFTMPAEAVTVTAVFEEEVLEETVDGVVWKYTVNGNGEATVTGAEPANGDLNVPESLGGYPVREIAENAFSDNLGITSLTIRCSEIHIGACAFSGCAGLVTVEIPCGITEIGLRAFADCSKLEELGISGSSDVIIGSQAFESCPGLFKVAVSGGSNVFIGSQAFAGCRVGLATIVGTNGVSIDSEAFGTCEVDSVAILGRDVDVAPGAFYGCRCWDVVIRGDIVDIGNQAFSGCTVENVAIAAEWGDVAIGDGAFDGCSELQRAEILSAGCFALGEQAFHGCSGLASMRLECLGEASAIGDQAFAWCSGLAELEIPDGVASLGTNVFEGCCGLLTLSVPGEWKGMGMLANASVPEGCTVMYRDVQLVNGVTWHYSISSGVATVTGAKPAEGTLAIPEKLGGYPVASIGEDAFAHCYRMTSVTIPDSVTSIGRYSFFYCNGLTNVIIGGGVMNIGEGAFYACNGLVSLTIPDNVETIGTSAFFACNGLESIEVGIGNVNFESSDGVLFDKGKRTLIQCPCKKSENYVIPGNVEFIEDHAFYECDRLLSIAIPESTTRIGAWAFFGCDGLKSVTIPDGVASIGVRAFSSCRGLENIEVGSGNTKYASENGVLFDKNNVVLIHCPAGKRGNCIIPANVGTILGWAFQNCSGLSSVSIPDSVTSIGEGAFYSCSGLVSLSLPNGVVSVGANAFKDCSELKTLSVPLAWEGTDMLAMANVPEGCKVIYRATEDGILSLELERERVREDAGGVRCVVRRTGSLGAALEVGVTSSRPGDVRVPGAVTIAAGARVASFTAEVLDNTLLDGERTAVISVSAAEYGAASAELTVLDDEVPGLSLEADAGRVREGGTLRVLVSREGCVAETLAVQLSGLRAGRVEGPSSVTIAAGERSAVFEVSVPDNDVAQAETAWELRASAAGYSSAVLEFVVEDDDVPGVRLELHPDAVGEGAGGNAVLATLSRTDTGKGLDKAITVQLAASPAGQVVMPAEVTIPANTVSVRFGITPVDNGAVDGVREVTINGLVAIASCGCGGQPSDGEAIRAVLRVTDDDVPALSLRAEPTTMKEGVVEAGWLVLGHNSALAKDLKVTLGADQEGEISIPATATIRAGETEVRVPVRTLDDGVEDGGKLVVVRAEDSSGTFAPASTWLQVSDQNLPDLAVARVEAAATAVTKAGFAVRFTVTNAGFAACTRAVPYAVHVVRAQGAVPGSNTVVSTGTLSVGSGLPVGGVLETELEVAAPELPGDAWVAVVLDPDGLVPELDNANNTGWSGAVGVAAAWTATVAADAETYLPGDTITLAGTATLASGGAASGVEVDVYLLMDGMRRTLKARTGTDGAFTAVFTPSAGEAGHYGAGACYPGSASGAVQDEFDVLGLRRASAENVIWDIALGDAETRTVTLRNMSGVALTGLSAAFSGVPKECGLSWELPSTLAGHGSAAFKITATATGLTEQVQYEKFSVRVSSAEGVALEFPLYFHAQTQKAYLRASPGSIDTTMAVGHERYIDVTVFNDGKGESGAVSATATDVPWLKVVDGGHAENLASGESMTVTLLLCPSVTDGLALTRPLTGGDLVVNCINGQGCRVPLKFTPTSEATGNLRVTAMDDNTYRLASAPNLSGASVRVSNRYTDATVAIGTTGPDGTWAAEGLPEGTYRVTVTAANHETTEEYVTVEPGRTAMAYEFLQWRLVRATWKVVKTEIGDSYEVQLVLDYETTVPAPIVKTTMPDELPELEWGGSHAFSIMLENSGSIAAERVTLMLPDIEGYSFTLSENGMRLPAKSSKFITVVLSREGENGPSMRAAGSSAGTTEKIRRYAKTGVDYKCGPELLHYEYTTMFYLGERTLGTTTSIPEGLWVSHSSSTSSEPTRSGDWGIGSVGAGGFHGEGTETMYYRRNCNPCATTVLKALRGCGFNHDEAMRYNQLFMDFEKSGYLVPAKAHSVTWWKNMPEYRALASSIRQDIIKYAYFARAAYADEPAPVDPHGKRFGTRFTEEEYEDLLRDSPLIGFLNLEYQQQQSSPGNEGFYLNWVDGFSASLFHDADGGIVLALRGTEFRLSFEFNLLQSGILFFLWPDPDLIADYDNFFGRATTQYQLANLLLQEVLKRYSGKITVVGHSLGGGMVQFAMAGNDLQGRVTGYTYNSAGLASRYENDRNGFLGGDVINSAGGEAAAAKIINVRNEGDSVSFFRYHLGAMYNIPNPHWDISLLTNHRIGTVVENLEDNSDMERDGDWELRKGEFLRYMDLTMGPFEDIRAKTCLKQFKTICAAYGGKSIEEMIESAAFGQLLLQEFDTGNSNLDEALRQLDVVVQAEAAMEGLFDMAMGDEEWLRCDAYGFNAFWKAFLSKVGAADAIDEGDLSEELPSRMDADDLSRLVSRWNGTMAKGQIRDFKGDISFGRVKQYLDALGVYQTYMETQQRSRRKRGGQDETEQLGQDEEKTLVGEYILQVFERVEELLGQESEKVCASVEMKFSQTLAMTREAFDGTLTMYNGNETTPIRDLKLEVSVLDVEGNECKDLFEVFANGTAGDMGGEDVLAGGMSVAAGKTGSAMVRFIPERGAAPTEEKLYRFGGTVTYTDPFSGEQATIRLTPVALTVKPSPYLHLDYFVQRDVYGDDPFTADVVEAGLPAELAVLVRNVGGGEARNVTIASVQPETVRNEKGLAIDFRMSDYSVDSMALNGATAHLGLNTASLGTIPAGASQVAQWWLTASIQGHFTGMKATVVPVNSWNTPDTALVDTNVAVHKLIRSVVADADGLPDFLTSEEGDLYGLADTIWTSAGKVLDVVPAGNVSVSGSLAGGGATLSVRMTATVRGWTCGWKAVPGAERYEIVRVVRSDGSEVPLRNVWITDRVFRDGADPVWETRLHLLDECAAGEQAYTVTLAAKAGSGPAVVTFGGLTNGAVVAASPDALTVEFSADVDGATFGTDDLVLRRQGTLVDDLSGLRITGAGTRWTVSGLGSVCAADGRYELVVQAAGIAGTDGVLGSVGRSVSWTVCGDTTGPAVLKLERETGLQGEVFRLALSEAAGPGTAVSGTVTLTRNGATVALPGATAWTDDGNGGLILQGLGSVTGADGTYVLTVKGSGLKDAAGNAGSGSVSVSWTVDTTAPAKVSGLRIDPDLGESAADGVTCEAGVTVRGTLAADVKAVTVTVRYGAGVETVLAGPYTPESTNLACAVELPGAGNLVLAVRCEDAAGNASETTMDVYLDTVAAEASWDAVETAGAVPVDCAVLRFSPAVVADDVTAARLSLTRDGRMVPLRGDVAVVPLAGAADGTAFEVTGLSERCARPGRYELRCDAEGVRKASSGLPMPQGAGATVEWTQASPEVGVTGLSARQRYPWNGLVDIDYEVSDDGSGAADTWVEVAARDTASGGAMPVWSVTGDGADGPVAEGVHRMTWNMGADRGGEFASDALVITMAARRGDAAYLVVDMSGGREATHWPVSGLPGVPAGGWTEEYKTTKLVLRRVEAGTFAMGSPDDEPGRAADELQHTVTLTRTYWMGVFEITQKQWALAMGTRPAGCPGDARPVEGVSYRDIRGWTAGARWPADGEVDANSFLAVLRKKTRMAFDLPTEAQWERACRAGTDGALNSGKALSGTVTCPNLGEIAKYAGNGPKHGVDDGLGGAESAHAEAGSYRPNAWGLYDMHGNVAEWCLDWVGDFRDGMFTDPVGSASGVRRAVRGGSWDDSAMDCRSASRGEGAPGNAFDSVGFRVCWIGEDVPDSREEQEIEWEEIGAQRVGKTVTLAATAESGGKVEFEVVSGAATIASNTLTFTAAGPVTVRATQSGDGVWAPAVAMQTFEVGKGSATVSLSGKVHQGDGTPKSVTVSTSPTGLAVRVTYDGTVVSPSLAGVHDVVATVDDPNWEGSAQGTLVIVEPGQYLVVDMSGGTNAASWPVSTTDTAPSLEMVRMTSCMVFRLVQPGTFTMGSPTNELGREENETPHAVTLTRPYWMGVYPVMQSQWMKAMGSNPSVLALYESYVYLFYHNLYPYPYQAYYPVESVSYAAIRGAETGEGWPDAGSVAPDSFLGVLRAKTGLAFDLPNEAQWEYACRAGTPTSLSSGKDLSDTKTCRFLGELGTYGKSLPSSFTIITNPSRWSSFVRALHLGSHLPNAWGLYDMHGNVFEWCLDWMGDYGTGVATNPVGPVSGETRVVRGGSWNSAARYCRAAYRKGYAPASSSQLVGFRLCCPAGDDGVLKEQTIKWTSGVATQAMVGWSMVLGATATGGGTVTFEVVSGPATLEGNVLTFTGAGTVVVRATQVGDATWATVMREIAIEVSDPLLYMVLDLSGGTNATSYGVSYLEDVPSSGWTDEYKTTKLVLRRIMPGTYTMGSPTNEFGRTGDYSSSNNESQHEVTLTHPFYMGVFEVTQKQWELVMGSNPSAYKGNMRPVECVSWNTIRGNSSTYNWPGSAEVDAASFMGKLRMRAGGFAWDLPTEAQWEYACRAGTTTALNSGKNLTDNDNCSNMAEVGRFHYNLNDGKGEYSQHTTVGSYRPNAWGLYDMHGNVREWCLDWMAMITMEAVTDPQGALSGSYRMVRGGGWYRESHASACRSAYRGSSAPSDSLYGLGFRLSMIENEDENGKTRQE